MKWPTCPECGSSRLTSLQVGRVPDDRRDLPYCPLCEWTGWTEEDGGTVLLRQAVTAHSDEAK